MKGRLIKPFSVHFEDLAMKDLKGVYARIPWDIYIALVESELKVSEVLREGLLCLLHEGHLVLEGINDQQEEKESVPPKTLELLAKTDESWKHRKL